MQTSGGCGGSGVPSVMRSPRRTIARWLVGLAVATAGVAFACDPLGDVTGDGMVDLRDALRIAQHVNGNQPLPAELLACADLAGPGGAPGADGAVDEHDVVAVLRLVVGAVSAAELTGLSVRAPTIRSFTPPAGPAGTEVTIAGEGFFAGDPAANLVFFGEAPTTVLEASGTRLKVAVPLRATTARVRVMNPGGDAFSRREFVVTSLAEGMFVPGPGQNVADFTIATPYGIASPTRSGAFTIPLASGRATLVGAVTESELDDSYLAVVIPDDLSRRTPIRINARSTAETLILLHPFLMTDDPVRIAIVREAMATEPAVQALADAIARQYPQGADGLDDPVVFAAWQQAVLAVIPRLPNAIRVGGQAGRERASPARGLPHSSPVADAGDRADRQAPRVQVKVIDGDYVVVQPDKDSNDLVPELSTQGYSPVDWLVTLFRLDADDLPYGIDGVGHQHTREFLKRRNTRTTGYAKSCLVAANQWTAKIDVLGQAIGFVMDTLYDSIGLGGADAALPLEDDEDGVYIVRAFSGSWSDSHGGDWDAIRNIREARRLHLSAFGINVALALMDAWSLVVGEDEGIKQALIKAAAQGALEAAIQKTGDRVMGDFAEREALQTILDVVTVAGQAMVNHLASAGLETVMAAAQKKLVRTAAKALSGAGTILSALEAISAYGKIGERVVGLMGYVVYYDPWLAVRRTQGIPFGTSPTVMAAAGWTMAAGPTPLESTFVQVGDPFAPSIHAVEPLLAAPGSLVTITGERFAADPEANQVWFGDATKGEVISATPTTIVVRVPDDAAPATRGIRLKTLRSPVSVSVDNFFIVRAPVATGLTPEHGYPAKEQAPGSPFTGSGTWFTLTGNYFDSTEVENIRLYCGGEPVPPAAIKNWQRTSIQFVPPVPGGRVLLSLEVVVKYVFRGEERQTQTHRLTLWHKTTLHEATEAVQPGGLIVLNGVGIHDAVIDVGGVRAARRQVQPVLATGGDYLLERHFLMPGIPVGETVPLVIWTPTDSIERSITSISGTPEAPPGLPPGLRFLVNSTETGMTPDGNLSLEEALACAAGTLNLWTDGYDDENEEQTLVYRQTRVQTGTDGEGKPIYDYPWALESDTTVKLGTNNGAGHEFREVYEIRHFHAYYGGHTTGPTLVATHNLDAPPHGTPEEGDRVVVLGAAVPGPNFNGALHADTILLAGGQTYSVGDLLLAPYDTLAGAGATVAVVGGGRGVATMGEGAVLQGGTFDLVQPLECTGGWGKVGTTLNPCTLRGAGLVATEAPALQLCVWILEPAGTGLHLTRCHGSNIHVWVRDGHGDGIRFDDCQRLGSLALGWHPALDARGCAGTGLTIAGGSDFVFNSAQSPIYIEDCARGVVLENARRADLRGDVLGNRGTGVLVTGGGQHYFQVNCRGNDGHGFDLYNCDHTMLDRCDIAGNGGTGVMLRGSECTRNFVGAGTRIGAWFDHTEGHLVAGNGGHGVHIHDGAHANQVGVDDGGVLMTDSGGHGILVEGSGTDDNNVIDVDCGIDTWPRGRKPNRGDGIRVAGGAKRTYIARVNVHGNAGHGVAIVGSGTDGTVVTGNEHQPCYIGTTVLTDFASGARAHLANGGHAVSISGGAADTRLHRICFGFHAQDAIRAENAGQAGRDAVQGLTLTKCEFGIEFETGVGYPFEPAEVQPEGAALHLVDCHGVLVADTVFEKHVDGVRASGGGSTELLFYRIKVADNTRDGMWLANVADVMFDGLTAQDNGRHGVVLEGASDVWFPKRTTRPTIRRNGGNGLGLIQANRVVIEYLRVHECGLVGVYADTVNDLTVDGVYCEGHGGHGMDMANCTDVRFRSLGSTTPCTWRGNGGRGLRMEACRQVTVSHHEERNGRFQFDTNAEGDLLLANCRSVAVGDEIEHDNNLFLTLDGVPAVEIDGTDTDGIVLFGFRLEDYQKQPNFDRRPVRNAPTVLVRAGNQVLIGHHNPAYGNRFKNRFDDRVNVRFEAAVTGGKIFGNTFGPKQLAVGPSGGMLGPSRRHAIELVGAKGAEIAGNWVSGCFSHGISLHGGAADNLVANNTVRNNRGDGVRVSGATSLRNRITSNTITANLGKGIALVDGGNGEVAAPVVRRIAWETISGTVFPLPPNAALVEVYADWGDEGEIRIAGGPVHNGDFNLYGAPPPGMAVHAVCIHPNGNTSEFGPMEIANRVQQFPFLYADLDGANRDIWYYDPVAAVPRRLTSHPGADSQPAPDPVGRAFAFVSDRTGNPDIWLMPLEYPWNLTPFAHDPAPDYHPAWSPDGETLAFVSERDGDADIYCRAPLLGIAFGKVGLFRGEATSSLSQPAGRELLIGFDLAEGMFLTELGFHIEANPTAFAWVIRHASISGNPLTVLATGTTTPADTGWHNLAIPPVAIPADGLYYVGVRFLTDHEPSISEAWSIGLPPKRVGQEGSWTTPFGFGLAFMITVQAEPSAPVNLTASDANDRRPAFSPRGTTIAFESDRGGSWDIWLMDADGANPRRIGDGIGNNNQPAWTADGNRVLFVSDRDGAAELYAIGADGQGLERLTVSPAGDTWPAATLHPGAVLFQSDRDGAAVVFAFDLATGNIARLTATTQAAGQPAGTSPAFLMAVTETIAQRVRENDVFPPGREKPALAVGAPPALPATRAGSATLAANDTTVATGATVTVPIDLTANAPAGIAAMSFELAYDPTVASLAAQPNLAFADSAIAVVHPDTMPDGSGRLRLAWVHTNCGLDGETPAAFAIPLLADAETSEASRISLAKAIAYTAPDAEVRVVTADGWLRIGTPVPSPPALLPDDDTGDSNHDNVTSKTTLRFTGTGIPGAGLNLYAEAPGRGGPIGQGTVAADGTWLVTANLGIGIHQLYATQTMQREEGPPSASLLVVVIDPADDALRQINTMAATGFTDRLSETMLATAGAVDIQPANWNGYQTGIVVLPHFQTLHVLQSMVTAVNLGHEYFPLYLYNGWNAICSPYEEWIPATALPFSGLAPFLWRAAGDHYSPRPSTLPLPVFAGAWAWCENLPTGGQQVLVAGTPSPLRARHAWEAGWNLAGVAAACRLDQVDTGGQPLAAAFAWEPRTRRFRRLAAEDILEPGAAYWFWLRAAIRTRNR